jgi:hypothetical protein
MVLNFAETPASGPGDGAKQWAAEEQHSQQKRPHSAGLVTRDQDGGSEAENKNRKDGQAELGCSVGGSRPEVAPESSPVLYRIWEYEVALARFNVPQPFVALVLSRHADIQTYASNPTTVLT